MRPSKRASWLVIGLAASLLSLVPISGRRAAAAPAATGPRMVELATLGGTSSEATAINDLGVAVGWSDLPGDAERHAVMWDRVGGIHDLGVTDFGVDAPARSSAMSVNNAGTVVGESAGVPFMWTAAAGMTEIPLHPPGHVFGVAATINNDGVIGGTYNASVAFNYAYLWSPTEGLLPAAASGITALNDHGQWIGVSGPKGAGGQQAVMGSIQSPVGTAVPAPHPGISPSAKDLNGEGTIVGAARRISSFASGHPDYSSFGFILTAADGPRWLNDLGFNTPVATAIDDSGRIAGTQNGRAATWSPGTEPIDLGVLPGDTSSLVLGLSNAGQAVGFSSHPGPATADGVATQVHRAVRWGLAPPLPPAPPPDLPPPPPPIVVAPVPVAARPNFTG